MLHSLEMSDILLVDCGVYVVFTVVVRAGADRAVLRGDLVECLRGVLWLSKRNSGGRGKVFILVSIVEKMWVLSEKSRVAGG
jgi:hypothetical protein